MKQWFIASVLLLGSTVAFATNPTSTPKAKVVPVDNSINIIQRPLISGLWGMSTPDSQCVEYYNFKENNKVVVNSNQEWATGLYEYQTSVDDNKVAGLALQIQATNNEPDCSNKRSTAQNEVLQYYVHWQDANNIQFCGSTDSRSCVVGLRRILP